jgi:hypothetical protein
MTAKKKLVSARQGRNQNQAMALARTYLISEIDSLISLCRGVKRSAKLDAKPDLGDDLADNYNQVKKTALALQHWHENKKFVDNDGAPRNLSRSELTELANLVTGNEVERAAVTENLMHSRVVSEQRSTYRPLGRSVLIELENEYALAYATFAISRLLSTIRENMGGGIPRKFERQVSEVQIRAKDFPMFLNFVRNQGEAFIDSVDDWLTERKAPEDQHGNIKVGVGAFAFSETKKDTKKIIKRARKADQLPKSRKL